MRAGCQSRGLLAGAEEGGRRGEKRGGKEGEGGGKEGRTGKEGRREGRRVEGGERGEGRGGGWKEEGGKEGGRRGGEFAQLSCATHMPIDELTQHLDPNEEGLPDLLVYLLHDLLLALGLERGKEDHLYLFLRHYHCKVRGHHLWCWKEEERAVQGAQESSPSLHLHTWCHLVVLLIHTWDGQPRMVQYEHAHHRGTMQQGIVLPRQHSDTGLRDAVSTGWQPEVVPNQYRPHSGGHQSRNGVRAC